MMRQHDFEPERFEEADLEPAKVDAHEKPVGLEREAGNSGKRRRTDSGSDHTDSKRARSEEGNCSTDNTAVAAPAKPLDLTRV